MDEECTFREETVVGYDEITGQHIIESKEGYLYYKEWNKNNDCKYFKKRFWLVRKSLILCVDCKNFKDPYYI